MTWSRDASYRGGMKTLELYGPKHYAAITRGGVRRARITQKEMASRPRSPRHLICPRCGWEDER